MISNVEEVDEFLLKGWAIHEERPSAAVSLDIFVNRQLISRIAAETYRSDLQAAGHGDGYHAFFFNPFDYLSPNPNQIEVRESASAALLTGGSRAVCTDLAANGNAFRQALLRSRLRWADCPTQSNNDFTGFFGHMRLAAHFHPALRILELGPGEGHVLAAMQECKCPFGSYLGLDVSRPAVDMLHSRFASEQVRFLTGDAERYPLHGEYDLIVASSVCETLFPSFLSTVSHVQRVLTRGGLFCFDLVAQDDRVSISRASWEGDDYLRIYSRAEIRRLLHIAGLEFLQADIFPCQDNRHRVFITATKPFPLRRKLFKNL